MKNLSYLEDRDFLRRLDNDNNKVYWAKIEILDDKEKPIKSIEGKVKPGSSISIDGNSSVRRTCNITFIADEETNDLTNVNNLLSINKRVRIFTGLQNNISSQYDDIIWFPQGIFVITQPNISHNSSGCTIGLSCKDKMCLLNGECGGNFPTSVTFHEYSQIIGEKQCEGDPAVVELEPNEYTIYCYEDNGTKYKKWRRNYGWEPADESEIGQIIDVPQLIYDIIQTLVCNYGGESMDKIFINDVPLEIKQLVRYTGSNSLYYNTATGQYVLNADIVKEGQNSTWQVYNYNEDVGYIYTDFVYPGQLISNIGDNVCTILDKIKTTLGNFEYFYDLDGNFVFQQIKNYLNYSYDPTDTYRLDNGRKVNVTIEENGLSIIDDTNYKVDFNSNDKTIYTFTEGNGLVTAFTNTPVYSNLKNDFHIWGQNGNNLAIHYHLAIKQKPDMTEENLPKRAVVYIKKNGEYTGGIRLAGPSDVPTQEEPNPDYEAEYVPADWRAELYLRGLEKQKLGIRPDIYEQELLDLFDSIYNFKEKKFKADMVLRPNDLLYFFDYLEPTSSLYDCSVETVGSRLYSYKQDKVIKLYNMDVPNQILISSNIDDESREKIIDRCDREGQSWVNIDQSIYKYLSLGTVGYSAQEVARDLLYQYTNYNESITIQCVPIFYLEPNRRITVYDQKVGISGDYVIKSISMPIGGNGTMNINAIKAVDRI